jgi:hypothetical protein
MILPPLPAVGFGLPSKICVLKPSPVHMVKRMVMCNVLSFCRNSSHFFINPHLSNTPFSPSTLLVTCDRPDHSTHYNPNPLLRCKALVLRLDELEVKRLTIFNHTRSAESSLCSQDL